ncbi:nitrate transporter [Roseobacter denitrificans]|uniref:Nitrate transport ATP-binding protein n=1 Tax=Roseobacter denitrificans (strain ATCC 33942 / OCh 114) TaxID=375451 RepID=Q160I2_ROSDO|nr:CmpA/NrtA family ABC transporter substrate-binding protein [Roseobacter denitrificans]ABG33611.1 nitrate transport ATP-binding protein [Roseobacter denitrificans OCh 114]AVL52913.1 nitrate transporter [Roseobacter denitrificans]SFG03633.1 NitT/TauT family transport system ATP-binding protein [Roseobacter denitrificans OCh 114]
MSHTVLNCGYVPLVDCAPLVIAKELGFAGEEGLALNLVRQPSWSALRDMLALGHLDAAQMLSPMPVAMSIGLGGLPARVDTLMVLSVNGTVFGVSNDVALDIGAVQFGDAKALLSALSFRKGTALRVGVPFHYSMHRLLLSLWTSSAPDLQIEEITVPPPRMADAVADGFVDAFWVGEPWGSVAVGQDVAQLMMTGKDVWQFAPEKVLAARHDWVEAHRDAAAQLMRAVYKASAWLDAKKNTPLAVEILARSEHLSMSPDLIDPALSGDIVTKRNTAPTPVGRFLQFHKHAATFPWRSQAAWIASQLGADAVGIEKAKACFRADLYRQNLASIGADMPGASEKEEGALHFETAVASSRGHMILSPDAFFDGRTYDFS